MAGGTDACKSVICFFANAFANLISPEPMQGGGRPTYMLSAASCAVYVRELSTVYKSAYDPVSIFVAVGCCVADSLASTSSNHSSLRTT